MSNQEQETRAPDEGVKLGEFDLLFSSPDDGLDLVFGLPVGGGGQIPETLGELALPILTPKPSILAGFNEHIYKGELLLGIPTLAFTFKGFYDVGTFKGFARYAAQGFSEASLLYENKQTKFQESQTFSTSLSSRFSVGVILKVRAETRFQEALTLKNTKMTFFEEAQPVKTTNISSWQEAELVSIHSVSLFERADDLSAITSSASFQIGQVISRHFDLHSEGAASLNAVTYSFKNNYSDSINASFDMAYEFAEYPINVVKPVKPVVPPKPPFDPRPYDHDISFWCHPSEEELDPSNSDIIFNNCALGRPPIKVDYTEPYFVINSIELINLETGETIQSTGISFSTDTSSFAWSGSMTVAATEISKLESPTNKPVKVALTFNGHPAVFMVQRISKTVAFNNSSYKVDLVSPTMLLDSPYSRLDSKTVSTASSPQALIESLLSTLVTGLTLNWQYVSTLDWTVAANTFSYQEASPIKAIGTLLEGSAAFMYSELNGTQLTIKRKRQVEFWEQGTSPISLTTDFLTSLSFEREQHRNFDAVYVISGLNGSAGLTAHVLREEYAGTELAPQIVAPTLTSPTVARDAGKFALGTAGIVETRTLSQPIIEGYPLVLPSDLVQFVVDGTTYIGTVISTSVSLKFNSQYQNFVVEVVKGFI